MIKGKEILILILVALIAPLWVLWGNTFPAFDYFLNKADNHGIMIKKNDLGENTFLSFPYYKNQPFSKVDLDLKMEEDFVSKLNQSLEIAIFENYEAVAYPITGEINNSEELGRYLHYNNNSELPNGTFFSNGESAFFISRGQYQPILSGEIFEKLGFDWNVIIPQESGIFSELEEEGEKIVFNSAHPDGVILKIEQDIYLVWEEKLLKIKNEEILKEAWADFYTVPASNLIELDSCVLATTEKKGELKCEFDVSGSIGPSLPYIFKFNQGGLESKIVDAKATIKVSAKPVDAKDSFLVLLVEIKEKLVTKYGGYLF